VIEETKDKAPTWEMDGEFCPNKSVRTTNTLDSVRRHSFIDSIIGVSLPDMWKGFNRDCYDGTTDPDEYMDAYTTHMSLYTSYNAYIPLTLVENAQFTTSYKDRSLRTFVPRHAVAVFVNLIKISGFVMTVQETKTVLNFLMVCGNKDNFV